MKIQQNLIDLIEQNRTSKFAVYLSEDQLNDWAWSNNCANESDGTCYFGLVKYLLSGLYEVDLIKDSDTNKFKVRFIKWDSPLFTLEKKLEFSNKDMDIMITLIIDVHNFTPSRPAPPCSNPDSPAFSDPGDDGEVEYRIYYKDEFGYKRELPEFLSPLDEDEDLYDEIYEICYKRYEQECDEQMQDYFIDSMEADNSYL